MSFKIKSRQTVILAIFTLYLLPLLLFFLLLKNNLPLDLGLFFWSIGLLMLSLFSLVFVFLLIYWEKTLSGTPLIPLSAPAEENVEPQPTTISEEPSQIKFMEEALKQCQETELQLLKDLEEKHLETIRLAETKKTLETELQKIIQRQSEKELLWEEELKGKENEIRLLQETIQRQKAEMDTRQSHISLLDGKIHNLSHEIKTLLDVKREPLAPYKASEMQAEISDWDNEKNDRTKKEAKREENALSNEQDQQAEALLLLKKCILMTQKMAGANYLTNDSSRYREFSSSYYGIDQRRLFDLLRQETGGLIIVFSPKDHKPLFVNPESKRYLGWLPEKVTADFFVIIQPSLADWKKALLQLKDHQESHLRLLAKTKEGKEIFLDTFLATVPQGLFRDYIISVCQPA